MRRDGTCRESSNFYGRASRDREATFVANHKIYNNKLIKVDSLGGNQNFILSSSSGSDSEYRYYARWKVRKELSR